MFPSLLLQAASATVTTPPPSSGPSVTMAVIGVATGVLALILAVAAAIVYAYRMGGVGKEMEATKQQAVTANEALSATVATGFSSLHRRMDEEKEDLRKRLSVDEERREELTRWRSATDTRLGQALDIATRANRRAHKAATLCQGAITQQEVHTQQIATLKQNDDERREAERRVGPPDRRHS